MTRPGSTTAVERIGAVAVHVTGTGEPVLALHGIGGAGSTFAPLPGHRLVAWDAPGYGSSPDPDPALDMDGLAALAAGIAEQLGAPVHLVGVSWGGVIATRVALRRPDVVRTLVLADSTRGSGRTPDGRAGMQARIAELAELGPQAFAARRSARLVAADADPAVAEQVRATMARVRLPGYTVAARSMAATDHSADLHRITVPTLVVVGEQDRVTGVAESETLAAAIPGARLVVLPGAGHAANQERPAEFAAALTSFWAGLTPAVEAS